ncbi:M23/M56 family metallopeptidase [Stenotrophomonas tumulicola]|uniref:Peptidoglycan DD-metalloendopeptidase family protein n=1 Tax=Stenotrophomonas tumulicola TaxID=1685415 RepID=A0A7W3FK46_9GAMM|nr:M23/M56 family metallopeptidase [Stenotrophomonas tumulicola]MBA8680925.1 peptidoglycan DD-metalloendopeptidase family protein [Stenotrophomonas tumulicola]
MSALSVTFWMTHLLASLVVAGLALVLGTRLHAALGLSQAARGYWGGVWLLGTLPPLVAAVMAACLADAAVALPMLPTLPLPVALDVALSTQQAGTGGGSLMELLPAPGAMLATAYVIGLGIALLRELRGSIALALLVGRAVPVDAGAWPGPASMHEVARLADAGIAVRSSQHPFSPFAVAWPRQAIIVPVDALSGLGDAELALILRHESAHLAARDPQRAAWMRCVGAVLWFNPFVRRIAARVQMAAELRCDASALAGDAHAGRTFAAAYLHTLRRYACLPASATALNHRDLDGHALRIRHMLHGDPGRGTPRVLRAGFACTGIIAVGVLSLAEVALATSVMAATRMQAAPDMPPSAVAAARVPASNASAFRLQPPLASARISGSFGEGGSIRERPHRGTDFAARVGTQVLAPAAGVVTAATKAYPGGPNYGTVVVLDHGDGWQSLYAHLDGMDVQVGQRVAAGEQIARVGRSGRVTGPHLHLEVLHHGQRVDPEHLLR